MSFLEVLQLVLSRLDRLNIPHMLGGSLASSFYGFARSTHVADLVVEMNADHVDRFVESFASTFFIDRGLILDALKTEGSFNVIHIGSSVKVDFFVLGNRAYDQERFPRRRLQQVVRDSGVWAYVQSPEDTALSKLIWFQGGRGVSETQWRDVQGILKVQAERLDLAYMRKWAHELGIADLLARALEEARLTGPPPAP